jgi:hypothetical protein
MFLIVECTCYMCFSGGGVRNPKPGKPLVPRFADKASHTACAEDVQILVVEPCRPDRIEMYCKLSSRLCNKIEVILFKLNFIVKISQLHCKKLIKIRSVLKTWQRKVQEFGFSVRLR